MLSPEPPRGPTLRKKFLFIFFVFCINVTVSALLFWGLEPLRKKIENLFGVHERPTLDVIKIRVAEGDAAFGRRAYRDAEELYDSALNYVRVLKASDSRLTVENTATYDYLEASVEVRERLARIGAELVERRRE